MQQPTMLVAVGRQHFLVLCDYTTSKKKILSALGRYHPANDAWQRYSLGATGDTYTAAFAWLMEVAEATAGHHGHKNVIWIGRGFPNLVDPISADGGIRGITTTLTPDQRSAVNSAFAICTNTLRDARITLYAVDPVGVSNAPLDINLHDSENGTLFGGQPEFDSIARLTGGKALHGRNDVEQLIKESAEEGANFYSLSYIPTSSSDTRKEFRKIRVVMNDSKLDATTREGYLSETLRC